MKLNYDCVRDMLLALEKLLTINDDLCHEYVPVDKLFDWSRQTTMACFMAPVRGAAPGRSLRQRFFVSWENM